MMADKTPDGEYLILTPDGERKTLMADRTPNGDGKTVMKDQTPGGGYLSLCCTISETEKAPHVQRKNALYTFLTVISLLKADRNGNEAQCCSTMSGNGDGAHCAQNRMTLTAQSRELSDMDIPQCRSISPKR